MSSEDFGLVWFGGTDDGRSGGHGAGILRWAGAGLPREVARGAVCGDVIQEFREEPWHARSSVGSGTRQSGVVYVRRREHPNRH